VEAGSAGWSEGAAQTRQIALRTREIVESII